MNSIQESLTELYRAPGVKGCVFVTSDGLVVAEALENKYREDVVAGLASYLMMTTSKVLQEGGIDRFDQFTVHAAHGKVVFIDLSGSVLVVLLDQFADLRACRAEIRSATQRLRRSARMC